MATPSPSVYTAEKVPMAGGRYPIGSVFRNMSVGWRELITPANQPWSGILAYSGMALDQKNGRIFLQGGGHFDSVNEGVYELSLHDFSWKAHHTPAFAGYNMAYSGDVASDTAYQYAKSVINEAVYPGAVLKNGVPWRPISRHTYQSVKWVDSVSKFMITGGSTWSGYNERYWSGCWYNAPSDCWLYDPSTLEWDYMGSKLVNSAYDTSSSVLTYHPGRDQMYQAHTDANSRLMMRVWNQADNTWVLRSGFASGTLAGYISMAVDTKRDRVVVAYNYASGAVKLHAWYPATNTWEAIAATNAPQHDMSFGDSAIVYSPKTDTIFMLGRASENLNAFNCVTGQWSSVACPLPGLIHTCGRLSYDNLRGVLLIVYRDTSFNVRAFAYRD